MTRHEQRFPRNPDELSGDSSNSGEVRRQFFLGVGHPPLDRAYRNRLGGRDLVIFPLLDISQPHHQLFGRIEEIQPLTEFERFGAERIGAGGRHAAHDGIESHIIMLRAFVVVSVQCVAGDFEEPRAKDALVADLCDVPVDR